MVVIGLNTRRTAASRFGEGVANAGPQDNQVPPLEEVAKGDKVSVVPPPMTDGDIREDFLNLDQAMTSKANAFTS